MPSRIRTIAVAVCRRDDRVLVERGLDRVAGERFHRAIGGGIEFGERAADAAAREWREELGLSIEVTSLLGVLENLFTWEARARHEIVFVFGARLLDERAYERDRFEATDADGVRHEAEWLALEEVRRGEATLYPAGVMELLDRDLGLGTGDST